MRWQWLADFPSTNGRIVLTLACVAVTCARVVVTGWSPSVEWLVFLAAMSGIDVGQYVAKRVTWHPPADDAPEATP